VRPDTFPRSVLLWYGGEVIRRKKKVRRENEQKASETIEVDVQKRERFKSQV
jgi:hypothetical protein